MLSIAIHVPRVLRLGFAMQILHRTVMALRILNHDTFIQMRFNRGKTRVN